MSLLDKLSKQVSEVFEIIVIINDAHIMFPYDLEPVRRYMDYLEAQRRKLVEEQPRTKEQIVVQPAPDFIVEAADRYQAKLEAEKSYK